MTKDLTVEEIQEIINDLGRVSIAYDKQKIIWALAQAKRCAEAEMKAELREEEYQWAVDELQKIADRTMSDDDAEGMAVCYLDAIKKLKQAEADRKIEKLQAQLKEVMGMIEGLDNEEFSHEEIYEGDYKEEADRKAGRNEVKKEIKETLAQWKKDNGYKT